MSENVSLNGEESTDKNTGEIAGEDVASRDSTNQMEKNSTSIEIEASELNTNEVVSCFNNVERTEEAVENDIGSDSHFESRVASLSLNSDSAEKSNVTADGGKVEDNSPASASCKTDTVANAENFEEEQNGIPAPEENPFLQSVKYLEKHQILRLFQNLAAQIVYNRPDNPLQYLVDELEKSREEALQATKDNKDSVTPSPDLFS